MTTEQQLEHSYLVAERLGILCELSQPNLIQLTIARREADEWVKRNQAEDQF